MHDMPDVEVEFTFLGVRQSPSANGYRPAHRITDSVLTTGSHHYFGAEIAPLSGKIMGTITFLAPEMYPCSLWIGKNIAMQEGTRVIGYAKILRILNPQLTGKATDNA